MIKKSKEIRRLLGLGYHLCENDDGWVLYRQYDNEKLYLDDENKAIMTSETNTEKDLLRFAKKHKEYDIGLTLAGTRVIIILLTLILVILNIFIFDNNIIRGLAFGIQITVIVESIVQDCISNHNFKLKVEQYNQMRELYKKIRERDEKNV